MRQCDRCRNIIVGHTSDPSQPLCGGCLTHLRAGGAWEIVPAYTYTPPTAPARRYRPARNPIGIVNGVIGPCYLDANGVPRIGA